MNSAYYANIDKIGYSDMLSLQKELALMRKHKKLSQDIIIFTEHAPTMAIGRDKAFASEFSEKVKNSGKTHHEQLLERGITVHEHNMQNSSYIGSGQFTAYLVNDYSKMLKKHDLSGYNRLMNKVILHAVQQFGIEASEHNSGILVNNSVLATKASILSDRVASCGVQLHMSREGTKHFSLLDHVPVISLEDIIGIEPLAEDVRNAFLSSVKKHFGYSRMEQVELYHNKDTGLKISKL